MNKITLAILPILTVVIFWQCSQSNEPKPPEYKDPREMTWTADTLEYPGAIQTLMTSIWASSPTDVHVVGHCDKNQGSYWHYDGTEWECIDLFNYIDRSSLGLQKVWGFSEDDFWIVGKRGAEDESFIVNYNSEWNDYKSLSKSSMADVNGISSNDIWFGGKYGVVIHKHNSTWEIDTVKFSMPPNTSYGITGIALMDDESLMLAKARNPYISFNAEYFIRGSYKNWTIVDSVIIQNLDWSSAKWGNKGTFQTSTGATYSFGLKGIWQWNSSEENWDKIFNANFTIRGFHGPDENYLLATADNGRVIFYDDADWCYLNNIASNQENILFYDVWTDGHEIFLVGQLAFEFPMKTIMIHGK